MSATLKKSSRKDVRVHFESSFCLVNSLNSPHVFTAQMNDMSLGGMSFFLNESAFKDKAVIQIKIPGLKGHSITFLGLVIETIQHQSETSPTVFRYSIRFDRRLSENEFRALIKSFALVSHF